MNGLCGSINLGMQVRYNVWKMPQGILYVCRYLLKITVYENKMELSHTQVSYVFMIYLLTIVINSPVEYKIYFFLHILLANCVGKNIKGVTERCNYTYTVHADADLEFTPQHTHLSIHIFSYIFSFLFLFHFFSPFCDT